MGYPTKLLIDRDGRIVGEYLGGHTWDYYVSLAEPLLRANPPPRVNVARANGNLSISWPASEPGYNVETAANIVSGGWSSLGATQMLAGSQYVVTVPATGAGQFFRLVKP